MPDSLTVLVRPGVGVRDTSHDLMAKKNATIAKSETVANAVSRVSSRFPPDSRYIPRSSSGVIARCCLVGGSSFS